MAHGVLRHRPSPAIDLHELWRAPHAEHVTQLGEDQWQEPPVVERRCLRIESTPHKCSHQHRALRRAAWKLLAGETDGEDASALAAWDHDPGGVEWMGHVFTSETQRHDRRPGVFDGRERGRQRRVSGPQQLGRRARWHRHDDGIGLDRGGQTGGCGVCVDAQLAE